MIAYCREIGVFIANPHVNYLEDGGRFRADNIQLKAKQKYDPRGLLNPGKMISFQAEAQRSEDVDSDSRNFAYLTWKQVDALPRESTLLILPTAAIEQHGHHLPLATDTLMQQSAAGQGAGVSAERCPSMRCRRSAMARAMSISGFRERFRCFAQTFMAVIRDLGASIAAGDFRSWLYNTHGGNTSLVDVMARDLRAEFGLRTFSLFGRRGGASIR
jgi:hypothetical protein